MKLHAIQTPFPSRFNHGATTWHIMIGRHHVLDERGSKVTEVAYTRHHAVELHQYKSYPISVACPCFLHQGEHEEPGRHQAAIAVTFWKLDLYSHATHKTQTIIDLMLAGV